MSAIVGVHGVGNYHRDQTAAALSTSWTTHLVAGFPTTPAGLDIAVAYYAPALRLSQAQGTDNPDQLPAPVRAAIAAWLDQYPQPTGAPQGPATKHLRAALEWFATQRGLDSRLVTRFTGMFFGEVLTYLDPANLDRRTETQAIVTDSIEAHRPRVLIAHSLGSVVAWETLWAHPPTEQIDLLLTLGSPLALPDVVYDKLTPRQANTLPGRPPGVRRWVNLADRGDLIAVPRLLSLYFDGVDTDLEPTISAFDFHKVKNYLANPTTAAIISTALSA